MLAIVSALGMPYTVLMPAIVSDVLHGGPSTPGVLLTASGWPNANDAEVPSCYESRVPSLVRSNPVRVHRTASLTLPR